MSLDLANALHDPLTLQALRFAIDLVGMTLLVFGMYYRRYRDNELATSAALFNIFNFAVLTVLSAVNFSVAAGFGLFAILALFTLRSEPLSKSEMTYFFGSIAIAVISSIQGTTIPFAALTVLFLLLGNIRAAIITALAIPLSMLIAATGMVQSQISGNLLSLGAIDFGIIVDGAVVIVENCIRHLAERQHELRRPLTLRERLDTVFAAAMQVGVPTVFGRTIIITVHLPLLALTGISPS